MTTEQPGKTKNMLLRLDPELAEQLQAVAQIEGRSISDVAREAIAALVEQRRRAGPGRAAGRGGGRGCAGRQATRARPRRPRRPRLREALRLGHNYVGTEHLLLGIIG